MNIALIGLHIQSWLPSKQQLSGVFSQGVKQQFRFCASSFKSYVFLFQRFFEKLIGLICQKFCTSMVLCCIGTNFIHSYQLLFLIRTSIDTFSVFIRPEMRNFEFPSSQQKLDLLNYPKTSYECGSSWDSNSSVSKTINWLSSIKAWVGIFLWV